MMHSKNQDQATHVKERLHIKNFLSKGLKLNIHAPGTGTALMVLALTQIPVAIKTAAEVACLGEVSHQTWEASKSHQGVNVIAVQQCNGNN